MSVDPLADKYPGWTPYNYTKDNPLKYIDPDGKESLFPDGMPDPIGELKNSVNLMAYQAKTSVDNFVRTAVPIAAEVAAYAGLACTGGGIVAGSARAVSIGMEISTAGSVTSAAVNLTQFFETKDKTKLRDAAISGTTTFISQLGGSIIKGVLAPSLGRTILEGVNSLYWDTVAYSASQVANANDKKKKTSKEESNKKNENKKDNDEEENK